MKAITYCIGCLIVVVFGVAAFAQQDKPAPATQAVIQPAKPAFTEVQELKLRLSLSQEQAAAQQIALLQVQIDQIKDEREKLVTSIEAAHPGWMVDRKTYQFIAVPAPAVPVKK